MNRKNLILLLLLVGSFYLFGQAPSHPRYIKTESDTQRFPEQYQKWKAGTPLYSDEAAEDEEFFISRVKPKVRFSNQATQVNTSLDGQRKLLWWVPIGQDGWNALPTYHFNSEVFSMWSYLDHYGNWTAPFVRSTGAFLDACHKNGVVNSVVASVPFGARLGATDEPHGKNFDALAKGGADKLLKYLKYYGIDGLGFNSEFNFTDAGFMNRFNKLFVDAFKQKDAMGLPNFAMAWYSLTGNNGTISGSNWDSLNQQNKNWFDNNGTVSNNFFLNYNWNSSLLSGSQAVAKSLNRSSYDVYAGMNMQGRSNVNWLALQNYDISIGIWGAHNMNMIFESRGESGSDPLVQQQTYQTKSEVVFTGGTKNPVNTAPVSNLLTYASNATNFHGMSKFLNARSALQTSDLGKEPFVTYFNLGNGQFFNYRGEQTFPNEWYNLGMQDYLPTWRWWITNSFMGRNASDVPTTGIHAEFTWEDAWFGGSCLKVSGETSTANYLHLFKTKFPLQEGDVLTVRYKVQQGSADIRLVTSAEGTESQEVSARIRRDRETERGVWQEKQIKVGARTGQLNLSGKTLALLGLRFDKSSADFSVLLGEVSIKRGATPTPNAPSITLSKHLSTNFKGVDFKLVYKMKDQPAGSDDPIYNSDVDAWYYKIYMQQLNEEPILCTTTTSWAAYVVGAPYNTDGDSQIRFGVSAVSVDGDTDSEIVWTDYKQVEKVTVLQGIEIDKPVIKANETFTVRYKDPSHAPAQKWEIFNAQTDQSIKVIQNSKEITMSLPDIGLYDLALTDTNEKGQTVTFTYRGFIQISGDDVGAFPQVKELKANTKTTSISATAPSTVKYEYVGRPADGYVSRALRVPEKPFAIKASQLGLNDQSAFSIAFWFKAERFNHGQDGTQLLNIRTNEDQWPANNWGYVWSTIGTDGIYKLSVRRTSNAGTEFTGENFVFLPGQWTHIAFVIDWQNNGRKVKLYANGKLIGESEIITDLYSWKQSNYIMVGGIAHNRAGLDGYLDEFQLYKKALTDEEVLQSMQSQKTIPDGLVGYWDFETDANERNELLSTGTDKTIVAGIQELQAGDNEGAFRYVPQPIQFGAGAPFITGKNYQVKTTAEWQLDGAADVTNSKTGTGEAGSVDVTYLKNGIYEATVTLKNSWGKDSKTFQFVRIGEEHKVTYAIDPANIHPNNVKVMYANPGSTHFEKIVSGKTYPNGVTLRLAAKPISLDEKTTFKKWTINNVDYLESTVEMVLNEPKDITVTYIDYSGVEDVQETYKFHYFPNPFVDKVNIQFMKNGEFTINVVNLQGQLVSAKQVVANENDFVTVAVDAPAGTYLINILEKGQLLQSLKVLKK